MRGGIVSYFFRIRAWDGVQNCTITIMRTVFIFAFTCVGSRHSVELSRLLSDKLAAFEIEYLLVTVFLE